jgi:hypothetical protein
MRKVPQRVSVWRSHVEEFPHGRLNSIDRLPLRSLGGGALAILCSAVRSHDRRLPALPSIEQPIIGSPTDALGSAGLEDCLWSGQLFFSRLYDNDRCQQDEKAH